MLCSQGDGCDELDTAERWGLRSAGVEVDEARPSTLVLSAGRSGGLLARSNGSMCPFEAATDSIRQAGCAERRSETCVGAREAGSLTSVTSLWVVLVPLVEPFGMGRAGKERPRALRGGRAGLSGTLWTTSGRRRAGCRRRSGRAGRRRSRAPADRIRRFQYRHNILITRSNFQENNQIRQKKQIRAKITRGDACRCLAKLLAGLILQFHRV